MKKNGFSLVEVMLIFMVMSVILAASIPGISKRTNAIPFKLQQGAYYCYYDQNSGRLREMYYTKDQLTSDHFVDHCVFNPPKRASIFRIDLFGAGAGGTDYVNVTNPDDQPTAAYKMDAGLIGATNRIFRNAITDNILRAYFGGKTIWVTEIGLPAEDGQSVWKYAVSSNCSCYRSGTANRMGYDISYETCTETGNDWNCAPAWIYGEGGAGGDGGWASKKYVIPTDVWNYAEMLRTVRGLVYHESSHNTEYEGSKNWSGYKEDSMGPGGSGRDRSRYRVLRACVPYSWAWWLGGDCAVNDDPPGGGQGGEITCSEQFGCEGVDPEDKKGHDSAKVGDEGDGSNYIPMLLMKSYINARHYVWGNPGTNGTHIRKLRFGLRGPCNIQVHPGGDVIEYGANPPGAVDLQTVVSCSNYTLRALGGNYSSTVSTADRWYERGKTEYDEERFGGEQPPAFAFSTLFYRYPNAAQPQNMMGRGGQGSGFVDRCSQRFTGYYEESIIDEDEYAASGGYEGRAPIEPGGLNAHDNQYYQRGYQSGRTAGTEYANAVTTGWDQTDAYSRMHDSTAPAGVPADQVKYYVAGYEDGFTGAANNREPNAQGAPVSMGYSGSVGTGATNTCVDDMPANSNGCYQELPQSNCLDDNEYGTVQGYYEVIRATKGQPGGVVIIW